MEVLAAAHFDARENDLRRLRFELVAVEPTADFEAAGAHIRAMPPPVIAPSHSLAAFGG